jgi:hypothetical protein
MPLTGCRFDFESALEHEWLLANGLGVRVGTAAGAHTA